MLCWPRDRCANAIYLREYDNKILQKLCINPRKQYDFTLKKYLLISDYTNPKKVYRI